MKFSRGFSIAVVVTIVAALAGIYINSRGHFGFDHGEDAFAAAAPAATPTPSSPASPTATTTTATPAPAPTLPANRLPLPKSKAEIIAALSARGFALESLEPLAPIADVDGYRVKGIPAAVAFTESNGRLVVVDVAAMAAGAKTNGPQVLDFAEIVGEVATGRSRDTTRQAIAQTMTALGKTPGQLSCSFGIGKDRFRLQVTRHDDAGYSFLFTAQPPAAEGAGGER